METKKSQKDLYNSYEVYTKKNEYVYTPPTNTYSYKNIDKNIDKNTDKNTFIFEVPRPLIMANSAPYALQDPDNRLTYYYTSKNYDRYYNSYCNS